MIDLKTVTDRTDGTSADEARIDIGILTKGKPTLGMALTSLLLQEDVRIRIHVVDTSARPVINRDDVRYALRLAGDRRIHCSYEYAGESDRAFSTGKLRLIRVLDATHLCLMDDDVVVPSKALRQLLDTARQYDVYGYVSPFCKNSPNLDGRFGSHPQYSPGALIYQDAVVRQILTEYYQTTVDVLDRRKSDQKVWETAFLTALFDVLDRPRVRQPDLVTYHLDYHENPCWIDEESSVVARSAQVARRLAQTVVPRSAADSNRPLAWASLEVSSRRARPSWVRRAREVLLRGR